MESTQKQLFKNQYIRLGMSNMDSILYMYSHVLPSLLCPCTNPSFTELIIKVSLSQRVQFSAVTQKQDCFKVIR